MVLKDAPSAAISDPGAADISGWQRTGLGDAAEFTLLLFAELGANAGHIRLDAARSSNVYSAICH